MTHPATTQSPSDGMKRTNDTPTADERQFVTALAMMLASYAQKGQRTVSVEATMEVKQPKTPSQERRAAAGTARMNVNK